jgi:hypothetical protein
MSVWAELRCSGTPGSKWVVFEVLKTKERQVIDAKLQDRDRQLNLFEVRLRTETYDKAKALAFG